MLNNALRKELMTIITDRNPERLPALRRSRKNEWLYATDIPELLTEEGKDRLAEALKESGWEYTEDGGWLLLRKPAEEPPEGWYRGAFGTEAACCRSLLKRHPGKPGKPAEAAQRALIKAGEEGETAYEEACRILHRKWAESLRKRDSLPALSVKYFGEEREKADYAVQTYRPC